MWIVPSSLLSVVKIPNSIAFNAVLASPFEISAKKSAASSSILALNAPIPFSLSLTALKISCFIFSVESGFNSNTIEREIKAPLTSKYGFSVVAPIRINVPSSTNGKR